MNALLTAIINHFDSNHALYSLFPDGLFHAQGGQANSLPLARFVIVSDVPEWTTGDSYFNKVTIQFDLFDTSDTSVLLEMDAFRDAFDFASLSLSEGTLMVAMRKNQMLMKEDEDVWHGILEYEFSISQSL